MTAEECHERASRCVAQAGLAVSEPVRLEFLKLAGQWRAIAVRSIFLVADGSFRCEPQAVNAPLISLAPIR